MSISTQCLECKYYTGLCTCKAFPEKIPQEIFNGTFNHVNEYPGDNGIRFEKESNISKSEKTVKVKAHKTKKGFVKAHERKVKIVSEKEPEINFGDLVTKITNYEANIKAKPNGKQIIENLKEYTAWDFLYINEYMKSGRIISTSEGTYKESKIKEKIDNISRFIKGGPKMKGIVYRGMKFSKSGKEPIQKFNKFVNSIEVSDSFMFKQFTSTTIDKDVAMDFSMDKQNYGILFEIKSKNGVYLNGLSLMPDENEVLFDKETKFEILSIDRSNPQCVKIIMEEI